MFTIGKLVNGEFTQIAGNFDIMNAKMASATEDGLMSSSDKKKLDSLQPTTNIADAEAIKEIFK